MNITGDWYRVRHDLEALLNQLFVLPPDDFVEFDSLLTVDELDAIGYTRSFPHLTCLLCSLDSGDLKPFSVGELHLTTTYRPSAVRMGLLPAACYKVYLNLRNQILPHPRIIGCVAKCFRHEDKPLDSYRGFTFTMKEFVCLGHADDAKRHIENGTIIIDHLMRVLGIPFTLETASDPFFDMSSSVATLSKAAPTKQEVNFENHAVVSLNYHRNYFGKKFDISIDGDAIHTSCVAFGLERWLAMLQEKFGDAHLARMQLAKVTVAPLAEVRAASA